MRHSHAVTSAKTTSLVALRAGFALTHNTAILSVLAGLALFPILAQGQINFESISTTPTQAVLTYSSPVNQPCSLQVADLGRQISIVSAAGAGSITVATLNPHGLLPNATVYIQNSLPAWNGWYTITSVPSPTTFTFANPLSGSSTGGTVGVLVDDVNPALFAGANLDSRTGNTNTLTQRVFVVGHRDAEVASDGNRYSRALQANAQHHLTLTCGTQSFDQTFQTRNIPLGDTHNEGPLADRNNPGQYAYPTIQWSNQGQALIDPLTGLRSVRATAPLGTPSSPQNFVTAIDLQSAWQNPAAPLNNSGAAIFTGPCPSGTCPLFLRADNLVVPGGATYTNEGNSLDWLTVIVGQASISNPACAGNDCMIVACLTVNGQTCASANRQASLTGTPASYTFGTQGLMDLWQASGAPGISRVDASQATGTVNYIAATRQAIVAGGNPFNIKWTAGSTINIAGVQYTIASVQSELQLTLVSGPNSNLNGAPYFASNFGVLLWKKTAAAGSISIGYTTYLYGSSPMRLWGATAYNTCSPPISAAGMQGYNCFIDSELYFVAADGSQVRDLGLVGLTYYPDNRWSGSWLCGSSYSAYQFDPQDGNTWYCAVNLYFDATRFTLIRAHYNGSQSSYTPGQLLPDCTLNNGVQPCVQFTIMQPNKSQSVSQVAPTFNPDYAASGFQLVYWLFSGVSPDGDIAFEAQGPSQDTPSWVFVFTLGDRTPAGTDANSVSIVAGASSYRRAPMSWCSIHDALAPNSGWMEISSNDLTIDGPSGTYIMTVMSAALNQSVAVPGGLNACPANPFGVTGQVCTTISVNGEPISELGSFLQNVQVGDVLALDNERMRVVAMTSSTELTVQRGYLSSSVGNYSPATSHSNMTLWMACGTRNFQASANGLWNYRSDPYGSNANWTTIINDPYGIGGHTYINGGVPNPSATVTAGGATYNMGAALCPASQGGSCEQVRLGYMSTAIQSPITAVEIDPPFAGVFGIGTPNQVDSHPGLCLNGWCMDARPMDGGTTQNLGSAAQPFVNVTGQLWKISGAQSILNRKILTTMAYVGRMPLVDVSGPGSVIGAGVQNSYTYCYAVKAGECQPGSAVGDVYVNAPYVSYPYCYYPGIAVQDDDTNAICIGDLGAYTGNFVQLGYTQHDIVGAALRRMGPNYSRWNQQDVFWNADVTPSGSMMATRVRWLDGVRYEDLMTVLPPYPASDGVVRSSFIPIVVQVSPTRNLNVDNVIVEFGYAENGDPGSYYCTSRQEACVVTVSPATCCEAVVSTINTSVPFYFDATEKYAGVPCGENCVITIPALSERVVYFRIIFRDVFGNTLGASSSQAIVTR
jgi:hypothetical protein